MRYLVLLIGKGNRKRMDEEGVDFDDKPRRAF